MATGRSDSFELPFPEATDSVNVHGDIKSLVERLELILPPLGVTYFQLQVTNNSGQDFEAGTPVYATGYTTKTTIDLALPTTTAPILGLTATSIPNGSDGVVIVAGVMDGVNTTAFTAGDVLYVGEFGGLSSTRPDNGAAAVGVVAYSGVSGIIIVEAKGNGTWGALRDGLS